jgi:hypothetical protein
MTSSGAATLDLAMLETWSVIRSTPPWSELNAARGRLADLRDQKEKRAYDTMERDRDQVLQYASVLTRTLDTIRYAVCVAVDLTRYAAGDNPGENFSDAMRVISESLNLRGRDEDATRGELLRCYRELFGSRLQPDSSPPDGPLAAQVDACIRALNAALAQMKQESEQEDIALIRQRAWLQWQDRLVALINDAAEVPVDPDYLRCRMRREAAGTILPAVAGPLRLNEWSDAYVKGVQRAASVDAGAAVPLWFPIGIAAILGFDLRPDVATITSGVMEVEAKGIERLAARMSAQPSAQRGLLVVRVKTGSLTDTWERPARHLPAISAPFETFTGEARINWRHVWSRVEGMLVEVDATERLADAAKRIADAQSLGRLPTCPVRLMTRVARQEPLPAGAIHVVAPVDLAAAWS